MQQVCLCDGAVAVDKFFGRLLEVVEVDVGTEIDLSGLC
jgi:hypothetical protein